MVKRVDVPAKTLKEYEKIFHLFYEHNTEKIEKTIDNLRKLVGDNDGEGCVFVAVATQPIGEHYFLKGIARILFPKAKARVFSPPKRRLDPGDVEKFQLDKYGRTFESPEQFLEWRSKENESLRYIDIPVN